MFFSLDFSSLFIDLDEYVHNKMDYENKTLLSSMHIIFTLLVLSILAVYSLLRELLTYTFFLHFIMFFWKGSKKYHLKNILVRLLILTLILNITNLI